MKKSLIFLLLITTNLVAQQKEFSTEDIAVDPMLKGTLYKPNNFSTKTNLVILIPGSGIPDRNGNQLSAKNNSLKFLSEGLASQEVAVFAYDKRAIAELRSGKFQEKDLSFEKAIADAKQIFDYFKAKKQFHKIIFAGHSEGSLVGMIASKDKADGFISLAGAGRPIDEIIEEQIEKQAPQLKTEVRKYLDLMKKGDSFKLENQMLGSLFRESVQPYMISWIKYNPILEIKKLQIPVLIVAGTKDIQVPVDDAKLLHDACPNSELRLIENMNHIFKEINNDADALKSYNNPDLPVMQELLISLGSFTKKL